MTQDICYTVDEAVDLARTSRSQFYRAVRRGEITPRKNGRRTLVLAADLHRWLENLPVSSRHQAA